MMSQSQREPDAILSAGEVISPLASERASRPVSATRVKGIENEEAKHKEDIAAAVAAVAIEAQDAELKASFKASLQRTFDKKSSIQSRASDKFGGLAR